MHDFNSLKEIVKKEDPIIMYLIVRKSLNMSIGKTAAQCAHASQKLTLNYFNLKKIDKDNKILKTFDEWLKGAFRKVVLKANETQWEKLKEHFPENHRVVIVDAGLTELKFNTETVIGLMPMKKSKAPKLVQKLRAL